MYDFVGALKFLKALNQSHGDISPNTIHLSHQIDDRSYPKISVLPKFLLNFENSLDAEKFAKIGNGNSNDQSSNQKYIIHHEKLL